MHVNANNCEKEWVLKSLWGAHLAHLTSHLGDKHAPDSTQILVSVLINGVAASIAWQGGAHQVHDPPNHHKHPPFSKPQPGLVLGRLERGLPLVT